MSSGLLKEKRFECYPLIWHIAEGPVVFVIKTHFSWNRFEKPSTITVPNNWPQPHSNLSISVQIIHQEKCAEEGEKKKKKTHLTSNTLSVKDSLLWIKLKPFSKLKSNGNQIPACDFNYKDRRTKACVTVICRLHSEDRLQVLLSVVI